MSKVLIDHANWYGFQFLKVRNIIFKTSPGGKSIRLASLHNVNLRMEMPASFDGQISQYYWISIFPFFLFQSTSFITVIQPSSCSI